MLLSVGSGRSVAWLARVVRVHEVVSSNLTAPTNLFSILILLMLSATNLGLLPQITLF